MLCATEGRAGSGSPSGLPRAREHLRLAEPERTNLHRGEALILRACPSASTASRSQRPAPPSNFPGVADRLLHEIRNLDEADKIRTAFEAVGASRPVPLSPDGQRVLLEAIDDWAEGVTVGELPDGIWAPRNALAVELHDDPDSAA